jgi:nucleotide-binding universal stress UspA family protein
VTPRRVLVATDGSRHADAAVEWLARHFPLPPSTRLRVVTVLTLPHWPTDPPIAPEYYDALFAGAERIASSAGAVLAGRWPAVETEVRRGDAREGVIGAARDWQADLLVVGARGLGAWGGALLGSVSAAIVHHAVCPVLVVKGPPEGLRRALVAVDGSEDSMAAARFFSRLPLPPGLAVRLLAVAEPPPAPMLYSGILAPPAPDNLLEERRRALEGALARAAAEFESRAVAVESSVAVGRPAGEIVSAAAEPGVDLAVVGARGLGRLGRWLLGSVSEQVLQRAECPVLVVRRDHGRGRAASA